jgi:transcriptional antiterminator
MTLKDALKEADLNISWLSERIGLSRPTLYKYLDKPDEFKVKHVRKIARYLHITQREALVNYFNQAESYE